MTELRPSLAQQEFIAKEIRHRRQVVIVRFMLLVLLLALWELAADQVPDLIQHRGVPGFGVDGVENHR